MRKMWKLLTPLLLVAMLMLSALLSTSCAPRRTTVIPADKTIKALPNGNYEVTPAWLQERYQYQRWCSEQLKGCLK